MASSDEDSNVVQDIVPEVSLIIEKDLPASTYEIRPNLTNTFKGTLVKQIVNEVLQDTLSGKLRILWIEKK